MAVGPKVCVLSDFFFFFVKYNVMLPPYIGKFASWKQINKIMNFKLLKHVGALDFIICIGVDVIV